MNYLYIFQFDHRGGAIHALAGGCKIAIPHLVPSVLVGFVGIIQIIGLNVLKKLLAIVVSVMQALEKLGVQGF